jgi:hypothetical protein
VQRRVDIGQAEVGDPTETALLVLGEKYGIKKAALEAQYPRVDEIPFDSQRKMMSTVHDTGTAGAIQYTKGALSTACSPAPTGYTTRHGTRDNGKRPPTISTPRRIRYGVAGAARACRGLRDGDHGPQVRTSSFSSASRA